MDCEVVVVGGGIGGLTVAALLAQRGVNVCLFERQSEVGGCAASFNKFDHIFDQSNGLYSSWETNEIHQRIFAELPVQPPEVQALEPTYAVRLTDQSQVLIGRDTDLFEQNLREVFPECADPAIDFFQELNLAGTTLRQLLQENPDFLSASKAGRAYKLLGRGKVGARILASAGEPVAARLEGLSFRVRCFVDAQLQALAQGNSNQVPYLHAALAFAEVRQGMFAIRGGGAALATRLAESIRTSGGSVRLDTPVLRLAYDSSGTAIGVDLLSGEKVTASKAIVSNLTVWDTYGKLVGLNRTPLAMRKALQTLRGWGAYLLFLSLDEAAAEALASERVLAVNEGQADQPYDPENHQLFFSAASAWDPRAPAGKRAVTVHAFTDVEGWFTFHSNNEESEAQDQRMLAACWERLHQALPELGDSIEVIDTVNPLGYYEATRRKLGMVGGVVPTGSEFWSPQPAYTTCLPNVFIVNDTTTPGGVAGVSRAALVLANKLAPRP